MENYFENSIEEIAETPGVIGVLCADRHGLCLAAKGKASARSAGSITDIANKVSSLEPDNEEQPVILLESNNSHCLIQKKDNMTLAIYKTSQSSS